MTGSEQQPRSVQGLPQESQDGSYVDGVGVGLKKTVYEPSGFVTRLLSHLQPRNDVLPTQKDSSEQEDDKSSLDNPTATDAVLTGRLPDEIGVAISTPQSDGTIRIEGLTPDGEVYVLKEKIDPAELSKEVKHSAKSCGKELDPKSSPKTNKKTSLKTPNFNKETGEPSSKLMTKFGAATLILVAVVAGGVAKNDKADGKTYVVPPPYVSSSEEGNIGQDSSSSGESIAVARTPRAQAFIDTWGDVMKSVADEQGVPYELMITQAAHESNFGDDALSGPDAANNPFGIKYNPKYNKNYVTRATVENDANGNAYTEGGAKFAKYDSPEEAARAYCELLKRVYPDALAHYDSSNPQPDDWQVVLAHMLDKEGPRYATDPKYIGKVEKIHDELFPAPLPNIGDTQPSTDSRYSWPGHIPEVNVVKNTNTGRWRYQILRDNPKDRVDTTDVPCAEGTTDHGTYEEGPDLGNIAVRICSVPTYGPKDGGLDRTLVNSVVSYEYLALVNAAKKDGVDLVAYGWRDVDAQIRLKNEKPKLAETPGNSHHESGIAVDVMTQEGIDWMNAHSEQMSFNLTWPNSEKWHYDTGMTHQNQNRK